MTVTTRRQFVVGGLGAAAVAPLVLSLESCGGLNLTLDAITIAIEVVLPFILQVPAAAVPVIENYLTQLTTAVEGAATELASSDTTAAKTEKIAQLFLGIVVPNLAGLGVPANIANIINAVAKAVTDFLAAVGVGTTAPAVERRNKLRKRAAVTDPMITSAQAGQIIAHAKKVAAQIAIIR